MILYKKINDLFDALNRRRRHPAEAIRVNIARILRYT
jgi:hypothetical protein